MSMRVLGLPEREIDIKLLEVDPKAGNLTINFLPSAANFFFCF